MHLLRVSRPPSSTPHSPHFKPQRHPEISQARIPSTIHASSPKQRRLHGSSNKSMPPLATPQTKLWSSRIELLLRKGDYKDCISSYYRMLDERIAPSPTTFAHLLKACSSLPDLKTLRILHNDILRVGLESHGPLAAALLDGYIKCGSPEMAHQLFEQMPHRDVVSWTVMVSQSCKCGQLAEAIRCFRAMMEEGVFPDEVALVSILSVSTRLGCLRHGTEAHGYLVRTGLDSSKATTSSLVNMYAKLGRMDYAERIVRRGHAAEKNVVAWTAMMMGLARTHNVAGALVMYEEMVSSGIEPTGKTISCALRAVCRLGFLRLGTQIHGCIIKRQIELDEYLLSGLIDVYATCGAPTHLCRKLFDQMLDKDAVSWTAMISAYGRRGEGSAALRLFDGMQAAGVIPDSVAFTAILSACCSSGMLHEGLRCFNSMMQSYGIKAREEHYGCLKGLIAKDGRLREAYEVIVTMGLRGDSGTWEAFLGACKVHGNVDYAEIAARKLLEIEPDNCSANTLLSHTYSAVGRWQDADDMMNASREVTYLG